MVMTVDDLIGKLEKYRGGKVERINISGIDLDTDDIKDIDIDKAWVECGKEDKNDIQIKINGYK